MSYKVGRDGIISFKTNSLSHVKQLYKEEWYFEAITTLHSSIEFLMNLIFTVYCVKNRKTDKTKMVHIKFLSISKVLYGLGLIDEPLLKELKKFNTYRNKASHEIFRFKIKKKQTDEWFKIGLRIEKKISKILMNMGPFKSKTK